MGGGGGGGGCCGQQIKAGSVKEWSAVCGGGTPRH